MNRVETVVPSVSAMVVTYHSGPALHECLFALVGMPDVSEVVIVNNGNPDHEFEWLQKFSEKQNPYPIVKLISGHGNIGFAAANNLAARHATGDRLLIINPDAVICPGSIAELEKALVTGQSPCLVGGKLLDTKGQEQKGGRRDLLSVRNALVSFSGLAGLEKIYPGFRNVHRERDPEPTKPERMPVVSGAFCYISADHYKQVGGFDEAYFLHVEDIDLCRKIHNQGGEVIYTPFARVMHYGSTSKVSASFVEWNKAKGLSTYFMKSAKTPIGRACALASLAFFGTMLVGRSFLIRKVLHRIRRWR